LGGLEKGQGLRGVGAKKTEAREREALEKKEGKRKGVETFS
jgi:hypothetical protein